MFIEKKLLKLKNLFYYIDKLYSYTIELIHC